MLIGLCYKEFILRAKPNLANGATSALRGYFLHLNDEALSLRTRLRRDRFNVVGSVLRQSRFRCYLTGDGRLRSTGVGLS
jgi:hypothetical protein